MSGSTFSYAQAAQGLVASKAASNQSSNHPSGAVIPAKAPTAQATAADSNENGKTAEQAKPSYQKETDVESSKASRLLESSDFISTPKTTESNGSISPPTRDMIEASIATLHREDDMSSSSIPNASSESTWENVSQASAVVDKGNVATEKGSNEGQTDQGSSKDESWIKVNNLKEAPIPTVNIWQSRLQSQSTKPTVANAVRKSSTQTSTVAASQSQVIGHQVAASANHERKSDLPKSARAVQSKRDSRTEEDQSKTRRTSARKMDEASKAIPPPLRDENSWPTPELAQDDRKKSVDKTEKVELPKITKKSDWKKVEIKHDLAWNSLLPNPTARRGGRATGRGGRDVNGTRTSPPNARSGPRGNDSVIPIDTSKRTNGQEQPSPTRSRRALADDGAAKRYGASNKEMIRRENKSPAKTLEEGRDVSPSINGTSQVRAQSSSKGKKPDVGEPSQRNADTVELSTSSEFQHSHAQSGLNDAGRQMTGEPIHAKPASRNMYPQSSRRGSTRGRGAYHGHQGHHHSTVGYGMSPNLAFKSPPITQEQFWGPNAVHQTFRPQRTSNGMNDRYGKYQNGFGNGSALPPLNTYTAASFQYPGQAMSAVPYGPMYDQYSLHGALSMQLEYYFSLENVLHDMYLRKHMDSQGWIDLEFIAKFKRVLTLTTDLNVIKTVGQNLASVDYCIGIDGKSRVRRKGDWKQWVLPAEQRDPSAQHDGVDAAPLSAPSYPMNMEPQVYGSRQASLPLPLVSPNHGQPYNGQGYSQHNQYFQPSHGEPSAQRFQTSPHAHQLVPNNRVIDQAGLANGFSHTGNRGSGVPSNVSDVVSDSQINGLMLVTRPAHDSSKNMTAATGTDGNSMKQALHSQSADSHGVNGTSTSNEGALTISPRSECSTNLVSPTRGRNIHSPCSSPSDITTHAKEEHRLPLSVVSPEPHLESYVVVRANALEQHRLRASSTDYPPDMAILYQFWSHYLVRNFNTHLFQEFHHLAEEDFARFDNVIGMHNLANYFAGALVHPSSMPEPALKCLLRLAKIELEAPNSRLRTLRTLQIIWQQNTIYTLTKTSILASISIDTVLFKALKASPVIIADPQIS